MDARRYAHAVIMLAVILVFGQNGFAVSLSSDPAAMSSWRGSSPFSSPDGKLTGSVDFAVYGKGDYDGMYKKLFADSYVYAYQVFNDENSKVAVDYFSVGLYADAKAQNAVYDPMKGADPPEGSIPFMQFVLPQSVIYLFQSDNIGAGEHSLTVLFGSDSAPDMAKGAVSGGFTGGTTMNLPTPGWIVPEPATFGLLIGGAMMAIRRRRKV
jgi:hypothetical protein